MTARDHLESAVGALWLDARRLTGRASRARTRPTRSAAPTSRAYLNAVVVGADPLSPPRLLRELQDIEADHGRVREERGAPRTLDLDLIQYGDPGRLDTDVS